MAGNESSDRHSATVSLTASQDTALPTTGEFAALIERSSLGVPGVAALRGSASHHNVIHICDGPDAELVPRQHDSSDAADLAPTWQGQLLLWLGEASRAHAVTPSAMVLGIADGYGRRSARTVLPEVLDEDGIVFLTTAKARGLVETQGTSAVFRWHQPVRQVTLQGALERLSSADALRQWARLRRNSQLDAWGPLIAKQQFADVDMVPVPEDWGAWRIRPDVVEFWQPRPGWTYDRLRFTLFEGVWRVGRVPSLTNLLDHRASIC